MSYSVWLSIDTGAGNTVQAWSDSHTATCSGMWAAALGYELSALHGKHASECVVDLQRAVAHMRNPDHVALYKAMEPSNGWGSHQTALKFLTSLRDACVEHPNCKIGMWY